MVAIVRLKFDRPLPDNVTYIRFVPFSRESERNSCCGPEEAW